MITFQQLPPLTHVDRLSPETGEVVEIRTNTLGLRALEVDVPKPKDTFRVVCLGDDAALAPDIAEKDTFCALLNEALGAESERPVEVINAGMPGYCPLLSLAWARQRLSGLQPDLVILCCDLSDVADNRRVRPMAKFDDEGVLQSVCHPSVSHEPEGLVQAFEEEFTLVRLISQRLQTSLEADAAPQELPEGWESDSPTTSTIETIHIRQTWEPIQQLRELCTGISADFVVVRMPSDPTAFGETGTVEEFTRVLGEVTEELGVPYLDVSGDFTAASSELFLSGSGRLSAAGHRLFSELLSWAIIHREQGDALPESAGPSTVITPANAELQLQETPPQVSEPAGPTPLPLDRQPRSHEHPPATEPLPWDR